MDTLTQIGLGAAIGLAGWRRFGRRALLFGGFCGLLPDLDVLLSLGPGGDWRGLVTHRGESHSLLVLPLVAVPLGACAWALLGRRGGPGEWMHLAFWALITHPLLDACTTYGTQLLAPLSRQRFSWDAVAIIDPLPTLPLLLATAVGLRAAAGARAISLARAALAWMLFYLLAGAGISVVARAQATALLTAQGFQPVAMMTPVPMVFSPLRRVVARDAEGRVVVGAIVPWAPERHILVGLAPPDHPRARAALDTEHGRTFAWFANDFLTSEEREDGVWLNDQRYGLFADPTWTPFRARLPHGARPEELELAQDRGGLDTSAELAAGWALLSGSGRSSQEQ